MAVVDAKERTMTEGMPEVRFVGIPDGPKRFVPELGIEVATFTQEPGGKSPALGWHVPLNMRGPFKPNMLANFDSEYDYRVDQFGWALCCRKIKKDGVEVACKRKAMNRYPRCAAHGGRLHPLDKLLTETGEPETEENMSRYQQFLAKQITVDDLDDEELMAFAFRKANGQLFRPKNIPRDMVTSFTRAIFDRSLDKLKTSALEAANTLATLMTDPSVEPSVRRQCAESILDRTVGKAPLLVSIQSAAPWETIFDAISVIPSHEVIEGDIADKALERPALPPDLKMPDTQ